MSAAIRGPVLQDAREQTSREFAVHHHRDNSHTQESLSAKDVSRAGGRQDDRIDGGLNNTRGAGSPGDYRAYQRD